MDSDIHYHNYQNRRVLMIDYTNFKKSPIITDDDVFIGPCCIVFKGVHVGVCSVVVAGSVVTKSIPNDCIAGGNPCIDWMGKAAANKIASYYIWEQYAQNVTDIYNELLDKSISC